MNMLKRIASLIAILVVASCGGGGSTPYPTGATTTASVSDLILTVSAATLANTGTASVLVTATALDASRNTLASVPVTLSADGGGVLAAVTGKTTGTDGTVSATLGIGGNQANRVLTVTAVSSGITKTATVQVTGAKITATSSVPVVAPSGQGSVRYKVVDGAGNPMPNQAVSVVATGFNPPEASGVTDASGVFVFTFSAPSAVGNYTITTNVAGNSDVQTIIVQPGTLVPTVTASILAASVSANPSVVAVNLTGSTTSQSEIRALFLGANNQPIQNVRARFDLDGDANSIGGSFNTGSGILYSDSNGVVTTAYSPGTRSSPTNGVTVRVCYGVSDSDPNLNPQTCTVSQKVTLTVVAEPLGVTIGTDATIIVDRNDGLVYVKKFIVSVSDAAGVAKADVNLVASVDLTNYRKGKYEVATNNDGVTGWAKDNLLTISGDRAVCLNEDTNRNGVLENGEDLNGDGQLWPRKPDVTIRLLSSKTAADGTAQLEITYAKNHGSWVDALITVAASGVSGSEGRATYFVSPVPVDAASIAKIDSPPAFRISPYGVSNSCSSPN